MQVIKVVLTFFRGLLTSRFLVRNIGTGLLLLGGCTASVLAQDLPDVAQGLQPYAAYHGGGLDSVSMSNGGLTVRIPLVSYPQRGSLALSYSVIFSSFGFLDEGQCSSSPGGPDNTVILNVSCTDAFMLSPVGVSSSYTPGPFLALDQGLTGAGGSAADPIQSVNPPIDTRLYVVGSDNSQHALGATSDGYRSLDDSDYLFIPSSPITGAVDSYPVVNPNSADPGVPSIQPVNGTVIDSAGRRYTPASITDPDGNQIQMSPSGTVDSIGRSIPGPAATSTSGCPTFSQAQFQPLTSAQQWTVPGPGGTVTYLFCYALVNIVTHFNGMTAAPSSATTELNQQYPMLQSIVLPNGQYWGFIYDSNNPSTPFGPTTQTAGLGQLMTLIYPTGGSVNYTYNYPNGYCDGTRRAGLGNVGTTVQTWVPTVSSRTMLDVNGSMVGQWTYSGGVVSAAGDVTVMAGNATFPTDSGCPAPIDSGSAVYDGPPNAGGKLLRKTVKTYWGGGSILDYPGASIIRETGETTTLDDGSTYSVQKTFAPAQIQEFWATTCDGNGNNCGGGLTYSAPIGKPANVVYTNFDGSIAKQENTSYLWLTNSAYRTNNILDAPTSTAVLDASSNTIESTSYTYDESSYSPGGIRGHATTVAKSLNMASGPAPITHTGWNTNGEVTYSIDANGNQNANGHTTDHIYDPNVCNGSVVTSTTNALNQSISGAYDCNTGLLTSLTDLNGNTTSVAWDAMRRITQVAYPTIAAGTPTTSFLYQDSTNTVTKTVLASPDPSQTTTVVFDGFGREKTRVGSDGSGGAEVDTSYDLDGRVASVTNPYHSSDTVYSTTTTYDALARPLVVTKPDGNTTTTSYTGPTTDTFDENNTHMQHTTDALGRLVKVMELGMQNDVINDPRSLETDYTYNALDDLTYVNQIGASGETPRTRSFTYDSLSRLITSTNPESGTICYGTLSSGSCQNGYDANGNLLAKTDANNVTTSYTYDALNRLKKRTSNGTPALNNQYGYDTINDADPATLPLNGVGRLMFTTSGPTSTANDAEIFSYDAMGRVKALEAHLPSALSTTESVFQSYDLAGNPTQTTYPDGRAVTQSYDAAGRLTTVTDTTSGGAGTVYFSPTSGQAQYTAAGGLSSASYGNGVTEAIAYNSRLQPCHASANSTALVSISGVGNVLDRTSSYANSPSNGSPCNPESGNNGNIAYIADNRNANWTQSFGYDGLNRLLTAARSDGGYNHTYNYDSFGNLIVQDNINPSPTYSINPATNQLNRLANNVNIYNYDAAGNLLSTGTSDIAGHSYTYNPLSQITAVDGGSTASYSYNGSDQRIEKQAGGLTTDYIDFAGQPLAEHTSAGIWTDYIYASGEKIAKVTSSEDRIHLSGTNCSSCGNQFTLFNMPLPNYTLQAGDTLFVSQYSAGSRGGLQIQLSGTNTFLLGNDSDGDNLLDDTVQNQWHHRTFAIPSSDVGKSLVGGGLTVNSRTPAGPWNMYFRDIVIVQADGAVVPLYNSGTSLGLTASPTSGVTGVSGVTEVGVPLASQAEDVHYFVDDHLGTVQEELAGGGWPVWQGQFTPFGAELADGPTSMHYKFTGKERDAETGLDDFGARYYASTVGRWMSPDWSEKPEDVPYSSLSDPQSLNLYNYVGNNPLSKADADGHCKGGSWWCDAWHAVKNGVEYNHFTSDTAKAKALDAEDQKWAAAWWQQNGADAMNASMLTSGIYGGSVPLLEPTGSATISMEPATDAAADAARSAAVAEDLPEIRIDSSRYPASSDHAVDAQAAGYPSEGVVNRAGASANRSQALQGVQGAPGMDRDEYPPAVLRPTGAPASTRLVPSSDNRGFGGSLGNQIKNLPDGTKVKITPQ